MTDLQVAYSTLLYERRKELGWSQVRLACESNVQIRTIRRVENCESVSWKSVDKLAQAMRFEFSIIAKEKLCKT